MFAFNPLLGMMGGGQNFETRLRCYSAHFFPGASDNKKIKELNFGGKILLPNSALDMLTRLNIQYPMMFKISSLDPAFQRSTHCGVLEFSADEGKCYLPSWMMSQLMLTEGMQAVIEYKSLPSATYAKFKPMSTDFLHITNPRAMLEVELRKFACLTKGDIIAVEYNDQVLEFKVMDLKPGNAVTIIECDMNVEFDAPEGYVEPTPVKKSNEMPPPPEAQLMPKPSGWAAFSGEGMRLDGKPTKSKHPSTSSLSKTSGDASTPAIVPNEEYIPGSLRFVRYNYKSRATIEAEMRKAATGGALGSGIQPFGGSGQTVRNRR